MKDRVNEIVKNWWVYPGFNLEVVASGFELPVSIAFPDGLKGGKALLYVVELYGNIKVIKNNGEVESYAEGLLNYEPTHEFPGSGESGITGICVDGKDLFLTMLYLEEKKWKTKVVRCVSKKNGLKLRKMETIIDDIPATNWAHHAHSPTIGFDGKLYVTVGDGGVWEKAQDDFDLRGKVLRLNKDGTIPWDNPNPDTPVYAKGFRNPFGATWRKSDQSMYISDNGPPQFNDHLFVALFGEAYREGRGDKGKRIVKLVLNEDATAVKSYNDFLVYQGNGAASPCGLAFGSNGLYFTDLHGEKGIGGSVYRIRADLEKFREFRERDDTYAKRWGGWGARE